VGDESLNDVESQQRFDGGPERFAAAIVLSERPDFFRIKEEQLRDVEWKEVFHKLLPVVRQPLVWKAILKYPEIHSHSLVRDLPTPADIVEVLFTIWGVPER